MNNFTEMVCNSNEPGNLKFRVPLEKQIRILATNPGTFVLAVLDCCRENFVLEGTRGTGAGGDDDEDLEDYCNLFMTHGCAPNSSVDARSTISETYFQKLRQFMNAKNEVLIPGRMTTWTPGNNGEHVPKHSHILKLKFTNLEADQMAATDNTPSQAANDAAMAQQRM